MYTIEKKKDESRVRFLNECLYAVVYNGKEYGEWDNEMNIDCPEDLIIGRDLDELIDIGFAVGKDYQIDQMVEVFIGSDDSGHDYIVPIADEELFYRMQEDAEEDEWVAFEARFGEFRTGGAIDGLFVMKKTARAS